MQRFLTLSKITSKKEITLYPNNKPLVTKELKDIITKKHNLFKSINHSDEEQKTVQRELKKKIQDVSAPTGQN